MNINEAQAREVAALCAQLAAPKSSDRIDPLALKRAAGFMEHVLSQARAPRLGTGSDASELMLLRWEVAALEAAVSALNKHAARH